MLTVIIISLLEMVKPTKLEYVLQQLVPLLIINCILILGQVRISKQISLKKQNQFFVNEWMMCTHIALFTTYTLWMVPTLLLDNSVDDTKIDTNPEENKKYTILINLYTVSYIIAMIIEFLILYMFILFSRPFDHNFKRDFLLIFSAKKTVLGEIICEDLLIRDAERIQKKNIEIANQQFFGVL